MNEGFSKITNREAWQEARQLMKFAIRITRPWKYSGWQDHPQAQGLTTDEAYALGWNECIALSKKDEKKMFTKFDNLFR